ncbi:MAG: hypothetical protein B6244_07910 [Candidatus Cloacimonetes bacterium 4572_55]|nr:MAG: hypothetical protein B6244_07910 [Candidatus Cloacimonetes bacterium 4572_55]
MTITEQHPIKVSFPSMIELTDPFVRFTEELCLFLKFDRQIVDNVALAVDEALVNAIRHGNKNNPNLCSTIEFFVLKEGLKIVISDHGEGFDMNGIADPLHEDNLLKKGGRGIFLMKSLIGKVDFLFDRSGTKVIFFISYDFR